MRNEMRDRLIELIDIEYDGEPNCLLCEEASDKCQKCEHRWEYKLADHLIENGVIVPPCKVGDEVYFVCVDENCENYIDKGKVYAISQNENTLWFSVRYLSGLRYDHTSSDFGKTVFLTREEAEQKLKGGMQE